MAKSDDTEPAGDDGLATVSCSCGVSRTFEGEIEGAKTFEVERRDSGRGWIFMLDVGKGVWWRQPAV